MGALPAGLDGTVTLTSTPGRRRRHRRRSSVPVQAHARARPWTERLLVLDVAVLVLVRHASVLPTASTTSARSPPTTRPHRHLGHGHLAPHRPHQPDGDDDRAGGEPRRLGDARLDGGRRAAAAWRRSSTSTSSARARPGRPPARRRPRRSRARSTRPRWPTASTTSTRSRPTTSAAPRPRPRSPRRRIDNTDPVTSTLAARRHEPLRQRDFTGTATANDAGSGVASVEGPVLARPARHLDRPVHRHGDARTPASVDVDGLADGVYDFRALATDNAGNTLASTVQTDRRVDNNGPVTSRHEPRERRPRARHGHVTADGDRLRRRRRSPCSTRSSARRPGPRSAPTTRRRYSCPLTRRRSPTARLPDPR